jgi:protein ImuA
MSSLAKSGSLARQDRLAALRASIADIERRPAFAGPIGLRNDGLDGLLATAPGLVQEVFTDERRHAGAVLGFALAQARGLLTATRQAVIYLQMLPETQEMGLPYGPGLAAFGFDPDALVLIRPANIAELLWAAEEAIACHAVAAVVADIAGAPKALDFTASRRFSLRAGSGGASIFLLRYGTWREASAAQLRWHIAPMPSAPAPFDARAPGETRWRARLEKGVVTNRQNQEWLLEWTKNGFQLIDNSTPNRIAGRPALSGAVSADLADGLSQTA